MSPVVVIATHQRLAVTTANIKSLFPYTVVLVVTDINEAEIYRDMDNVLVVIASNNPLGAKWQAGVDFAKQIPHSHIVITGSDDILAKGYIEEGVATGSHFVGLRQWYVYQDKKLYHLEYLAANGLPLGGGRIYSKKILERYGYRLFDTGANKLLDDRGWILARRHNPLVLNGPRILAVKGDWPVMNPLDLQHRNVRHLATYTREEADWFLYNCFGYSG
jgi:hypothetical protein